MRIRPAVAAPLAAIAAAAVVVATLTDTGAATAATTTAAGVAQTGKTRLSAPIVQPGGRPTSSSRANLTGTVTFRPVHKHRPVTVQRRVVHEDGSATAWQKVAVRRENGKGQVDFTGAAYRKGDPFEYRGVARRLPGKPKIVATGQRADVWQPVFFDEFNGRRSLGDKWLDRTSDSSSRKCSRVGDPRASQVRRGTLRLQVKPIRGSHCRIRRGPDKGRYKRYLNGQVSTQHLGDAGAFAYGTFAARIRFPKLRGQHGAFWLQPTTRKDGARPRNAGAELDIAEFFGKGYRKGGLASFLYNYGILDRHHNPKKIGGMQPDATRMLPGRDNWWKRYHVFSLEWTPRAYTFSVDGRQHFRTSKGVTEVPEYLLLSQLSSDWELKQAKKHGINTVRGTMHVDWARVWQN